MSDIAGAAGAAGTSGAAGASGGLSSLVSALGQGMEAVGKTGSQDGSSLSDAVKNLVGTNPKIASQGSATPGAAVGPSASAIMPYVSGTIPSDRRLKQDIKKDTSLDRVMAILRRGK